MVAESGLLLIIAGVFDRTGSEDTPAKNSRTATLQELCWMHLFPVATCRFDGDDQPHPEPEGLSAEHEGHRLCLRQPTPARAELQLESSSGFRLQMMHAGLDGSTIEPMPGDDFARLPGSHWLVHCPSPVAVTSGELCIDPAAAELLAPAAKPTETRRASPALLKRIRAGDAKFHWQDANGYYEHSFGINPLPLFGWDFLFVPDAGRGQAVVMQTYRGSSQLRYVEVCWRDADQPRYHRFDAAQISLDWTKREFDPVLGADRPLCRVIRAEAGGLRLHVENRVLHRIPLLRPRRLAVRHFFISEEIGVADWTLSNDQDSIIAKARNQPCGSELAHFRWRTRIP